MSSVEMSSDSIIIKDNDGNVTHEFNIDWHICSGGDSNWNREFKTGDLVKFSARHLPGTGYNALFHPDGQHDAVDLNFADMHTKNFRENSVGVVVSDNAYVHAKQRLVRILIEECDCFVFADQIEVVDNG